jgi:retron-type reverse transcriptase
LARKRTVIYTRYADDLTFSGDQSREVARKIRNLVARIVSEEGFTVNVKKTKLMGQGTRQVVIGVVVNKDLELSRPEHRRLRAPRRQLSKLASGEHDQRLKWLEGKLAYISMLNSKQAQRLSSGRDPDPGINLPIDILNSIGSHRDACQRFPYP